MSNIREYGFPFSSVANDRQYSAAEWREYFGTLIKDGIVQNSLNECKVKPQSSPDKTIFVDAGTVFIQGAMRILVSPQTLSIEENISGNPRIDRIVARLNFVDRKIEFAVLKGTPAPSPSVKNITRNNSVWELALADINLANGFSTITGTAIVDKRTDIDLCGASSMTIGVIPPSGLNAETVSLSDTTKQTTGFEFVDEAIASLPYVASTLTFSGYEPSEVEVARNDELVLHALNNTYVTTHSFFCRTGGRFRIKGKLRQPTPGRTATVAIFNGDTLISQQFSTESNDFVDFVIDTDYVIAGSYIRIKGKNSSTSTGGVEIKGVTVNASLGTPKTKEQMLAIEVV